MPSEEDIQYAIANTQIILAPKKKLETFGQTVIRYSFISEKMDSVNEISVREGRIHAEKPQLITTAYFENMMLEGFGDEARGYVDWLKSHFNDLAFLKYGFRFRKETNQEYILHEPLAEVINKVKAEVENRNDPLSAVIQGTDDAWEICLLKFTTDFIRQSSSSNFSDLQKGHKLALIGGIPQGIADEIDEDIAQVGDSPDKLRALADKLRRYGLFENYEDKFYELVRQVGR
ncbi:MAG: hypothetical protein SGI98_01565 [Verrucomicrobiota bacterium]|nr:hypothetical protein [Verrucomicrobiota bacterium]